MIAEAKHPANPILAIATGQCVPTQKKAPGEVPISRGALSGEKLAAVSLLSFSLLFSAPSYALDETKVALRLSLVDAVYRGAGSLVASGRYGGSWGIKLGFWIRDSHVESDAPNALAGVDYVWTKSKWRFGLGTAWIDTENSVNGTRWNFDLSLEYDLSNQVYVGYQHYSHGSRLGIRSSTPNGGWDLIGAGLTF
jgi:hypothetical protein